MTVDDDGMRFGLESDGEPRGPPLIGGREQRIDIGLIHALEPRADGLRHELTVALVRVRAADSFERPAEVASHELGIPFESARGEQDTASRPYRQWRAAVQGRSANHSAASVVDDQGCSAGREHLNTVGVGTVQNDIKPAKAEPESKFYTVKTGDTLWAIAESQYGKGNGAKYDAIFQANRPMLTHPDKIYPGQVLRIPPLL